METSPLLSHASLIRVSLDVSVSQRSRLDAVVADLDVDGFHTSTPGALSTPVGHNNTPRQRGQNPPSSPSSSVPLPAYLAANPALWTSINAFATRLLQRQQAALDYLSAIRHASNVAVAQQQKQNAKLNNANNNNNNSQLISASRSPSMSLSLMGMGHTGGEDGDAASNAGAETGAATGSVVPAALRYDPVLSSTSEDGHVNPMILQPLAEEGCFLQVPSAGFGEHCAAWASSSSSSSSGTGSSNGANQAALPLPDVVCYTSKQIAQLRARKQKSSTSPSSSSSPLMVPGEAGIVYGYVFFLCGEAFCPPADDADGGEHEQREEAAEAVFNGTTHSGGRRCRARGLALVLASTSPVLTTMRAVSLELVVCLARLAVRSLRNGDGHTLASLDRFLRQEVMPLASLMQRRGVSTRTMPGQPMLLQLPSSDRPVNVRRPADVLHPHVDLPLHILLCSFSFDALRVLHSLIIQEKRIVVVGCTPQHASACVTSVVALLSPLTWCAPLVPFLPPPTTPPPPCVGSPAGGIFTETHARRGHAAAVDVTTMSQYAYEGSHAEWWLLDALLARPLSPASSKADESSVSSGFLVGSTPDMIAPLMMRLSALEATTLATRDAASREAALLDDHVWIADARTGLVAVAPLDPLVGLQPPLPPAVASPATVSAKDSGSPPSSQKLQQLTSAASRALFSVSAANRPFVALELPPSSEKLKNAVKKSITPEKRQAFRIAANAQQERQQEWFALCKQELARLARFSARLQRRRSGRDRLHRLWPYSVLAERAALARSAGIGTGTHQSSRDLLTASFRTVDSMAASIDSIDGGGGGDDEGEDGYQVIQAVPSPSVLVDDGDTSDHDNNSSSSGSSSGSSASSSSGESSDDDGNGDDDDGNNRDDASTASSPSTGKARGGAAGGGGAPEPIDPQVLSPFGEGAQSFRLARNTSSDTHRGHSIFVEAKMKGGHHHRHHRHHHRSKPKDGAGSQASQGLEKDLYRSLRHQRRQKTDKLGSTANAAMAASGKRTRRHASDAWGEGVGTFTNHLLPEHEGQHRLPSFPTIAFDALVEVHAAFLEYNTHRLVGSYRKGLLIGQTQGMNPVQPASLVVANRVGGIDVNAFLPVTLGNSTSLAAHIRRTASFRQFVQTLLCVEKVGLPQVLRGSCLVTNPSSSASSSSAMPDCMNNYYLATPRMFCLLGVFFERARRRFGELFPEMANQSASLSQMSLDSVRNGVLVAQQLFGRKSGSDADATARPLRNAFGDGATSASGGASGASAQACRMPPALVHALAVLAGRTGEELDTTMSVNAAGAMHSGNNTGAAVGYYGAPGQYVAAGGGGGSGGSGGGVRRFFSKASKAMKHGLGGNSNTSGHSQTFPLPLFLQCFASFGTGPVCAYVTDRRTDKGKDDLFLGVQQQLQRARRVASQQQYAALHTDFSLPDNAGHCVAYDYLPTGNNTNNPGLPATAYANAPTPQPQATVTTVANTTGAIGAGGGGMEAEYLRTLASRPATTTTTTHFSSHSDPLAHAALFVRPLPVDVIHHFDAYHALLDPTAGTASTSLSAIVCPETLPHTEALLSHITASRSGGPDSDETGGGGGGGGGRPSTLQLVLPATDESQQLARLVLLVPCSTRLQRTAEALYELSLVCPLPAPHVATPGMQSVRNSNSAGDGLRRSEPRTPSTRSPASRPNTSPAMLPTVHVLAGSQPIVAPAPDIFADLFAPAPATAPSQQSQQPPQPQQQQSPSDAWGAFQFTSGAPAGYTTTTTTTKAAAAAPLQHPLAAVSPSSSASFPASPTPPVAASSPAAAAWDAWWSAGPATSTGAGGATSLASPSPPPVVASRNAIANTGTTPVPAPAAAPAVVAPAPGNALDELFSFGSGAPQDGVIRMQGGGPNAFVSNNNNSNGSGGGSQSLQKQQQQRNNIEDFF